MIQSRLAEMLDSAANLPSLPGVTLQIVKLTNDPECSTEEVVSALQKDPALASKILRVVNSPVYATRGEVDTLRKAVVVLGLTATQSLALSFSLVGSLKGQQGGGLDYERYWRRSFLAAIAAKLIGEEIGEDDPEALFLAALMQDLGMLVLDKLDPELYREAGEVQTHHDKLAVFETRKLGSDHSYVGGWILRKWEFSERLVLAVEKSHSPISVAMGDDHARFIRGVALSGALADYMLQGNGDAMSSLVERGSRLLALEPEQISDVVQKMVKIVPAQESVFDTRLLDAEKLSMLSAMALEALQGLSERQDEE